MKKEVKPELSELLEVYDKIMALNPKGGRTKGFLLVTGENNEYCKETVRYLLKGRKKKWRKIDFEIWNDAKEFVRLNEKAANN